MSNSAASLPTVAHGSFRKGYQSFTPGLTCPSKEVLYDRIFDLLQSVERQLRIMKVNEQAWAKFTPLREYFINDPECPELLEGMVRRLNQQVSSQQGISAMEELCSLELIVTIYTYVKVCTS